jgi:N-acetylmuramic acid 6-phosphate etherase
MADVTGIDTWPDHRILETLAGGQDRAIAAVRAVMPQIATAATHVAERLRAGGKLYYAGAGTSIRVAVQDGSELHSTFGMPEDGVGYLIAGGPMAMFRTLADAEDGVAEGRTAAEACTAKDALIAVAASGGTPYTIAAAKEARARGAYVVSVVNNPGSALGAAGDIEIFLDTGPEVIVGSTRMGAGTAQKVALNFISTLAHIKLGAVHDGLMVNVLAGNDKLKDRAQRIVMKVADVEQPRAAEALNESHGKVRDAILLCLGARNIAHVQQLLLESRNNLRKAMAHLKNGQ